MSQNIRIGVNADAAGAASEVSKIDKAAEGAAESIKEIAREASGAEKALDNMAKAAERLARAKAALERETGTKISDDDTRTFLDNFDRMRNGRQMGAKRLRQFDDFDSWYQGHHMAYGKANAAAQHRRSIFASGMQGTQYARQYGAPPPPDAPGGGGGFADSPMARRGGSMAMGFLKGGLALAGIGGIMGLLGSAVSKGGSEATSTDTLKRATGDLAVDFTALRNNVREATQGLGMAYLEGQKLANQFAREAGHAGVGDLKGSLRTGIGFSRSYGMDPAQGVGFFGAMRRLGVASDDQSQRRLALMIGESVGKSGNSAKADEVLQAIQGYAEQTSRLTLSQANVGAYGSYLTSLMATGRPGLDPSGASAILGAADSATRRGGAFGEASLNFSLAAMMKASPGIDPITAQALMEGGLFGTTRGMFGKGDSGQMSSLGNWYGRRGLATPGLDDTTNFEKMMPGLRQQYGANSPYLLEAIKNHFGLSSISQAAELDNMYDNPTNLKESQGLLDRAGVSVSKVSATGIQQISGIAGAKTGAELQPILQAIAQRTDVSDAERRDLAAAASEAVRSGNIDDLKVALVAVVGTKEQEQTEGQKTRQSLADLENAVTAGGALLLAPLNLIRDGMLAVARVLSPEFRNKEDAAAYAGRVEEQRKKEPEVNAFEKYMETQPSVASRQILIGQRDRNRAAYDEAKKRGAVNINRIAPPPDPNMLTGRLPFGRTREQQTEDYWRQMALHQDMQQRQARDRAAVAPNDMNAAIAGLGGMQGATPGAAAPSGRGVTQQGSGGRWALSAEARSYLAETDRMLGLPPGTSERQIRQESQNNPNARSRRGAAGLAQIMPKTAQTLSRRAGRQMDPYNPTDALEMHREVMRENMQRWKTPEAALRAYNSGWEPGKWDNPETNGYIATIMGGRVPGSTVTPASQQVGVAFAPATVTLQDIQGRTRGQVTLNPFVNGKPAGS